MEVIQALVDRQAVEPGAQARLAAKAGELAVGLDEHVLKQVLGVVGGSGHARQQPEEPPGMGPVHRLERRRIALAAPARQFEVVGSHSLLRRLRGGDGLPRRRAPGLHGPAHGGKAPMRVAVTSSPSARQLPFPFQIASEAADAAGGGNHPMAGYRGVAAAAHHVADRARCPRRAHQLRDVAIGGHAPARNPAHRGQHAGAKAAH